MIQPPALLEGSHGRFTGLKAVISQSTTAIPLAGIVGLGVFFLGESRSVLEPQVLHAAGTQALDFDKDGLSNHFEATLGTSLYSDDTDGDGFGDLEEFARGSDPTSASIVPLPGDISLNMSASGEADGVHLQIATYFTDGDITNKDIQVGIVINGEPRMLPTLLEQPGVQFSRWNTSNGGTVILVNSPFPESLVHSFGQLSLFSVLAVQPAPAIVAASAVDLASVDGVVGLMIPDSDSRWSAYGSQLVGSGGGTQNYSTGSIYTPIPTGDGSVPASWNPGEVCFQATTVISTVDGVVTSEVVAAGCISGSGSCPPGCSSSVGGLVQTFDPLGLIGG